MEGISSQTKFQDQGCETGARTYYNICVEVTEGIN
jgi:hypothetical protein